MNNILFIDKPSGITSFDVIRKLRKLIKEYGIEVIRTFSQHKLGSRGFPSEVLQNGKEGGRASSGARPSSWGKRSFPQIKMGHAGTLDPLATGLLIIGLEKATKELATYMGLPKEYEVLIEFGKVSTTYDADGELRIMRPFGCPELRIARREELEKILQNFVGEIDQTPPPFSAKRINGQRAYDLARKGERVELKPVKIRIDSIEILDWNWPQVALRVKCGKGTYIRSLAHDLGQKIGCGAYVKELRRTAIGDFRVENATKL